MASTFIQHFQDHGGITWRFSWNWQVWHHTNNTHILVVILFTYLSWKILFSWKTFYDTLNSSKHAAEHLVELEVKLFQIVKLISENLSKLCHAFKNEKSWSWNPSIISLCELAEHLPYTSRNVVANQLPIIFYYISTINIVDASAIKREKSL